MAVTFLAGDALAVLPTIPAGTVQTCVTSPPYFGLRDYGVAGQVGMEATPDAYAARLVEVFREVRRTLRDDGTLWLNLGDSYGAGKQLLGIPWRVAFALRADGWVLRSAIIWHKPNPMPESVRDRPTNAYENVFLFSKRPAYFYDAAAIAEDALQPAGTPKLTAQHKRAVLQNLSASRLGSNQGAPTRNARNVWTIAPRPYSGAHFAVMPPDLAERCIRAGSRPGDMVLDPFGGAGTAAVVAQRLGRDATLIELNPAYLDLAAARVREDGGRRTMETVARQCA